MITGSVIDGELAPPAIASSGSVSQGIDNLGGAVEAYLSSHFSGFPNGVPPPGLYHRILREIEVPLLTAALAATRGNQIRAADLLGLNRNTLRKKIQTSTSRFTAAAASGTRSAEASRRPCDGAQ